MAANQQIFDQICEAYEVLSTLERKATYDMYGEYGLKTGVTNHLGQKIGGYIFLGNSDEIFENFFRYSNPLSKEFEVDGTDIYGSLLGDGLKGKNEAPAPSPAAIKINLNCTLKELFRGCLKTFSYKKSCTNPNGRTLTMSEE